MVAYITAILALGLDEFASVLLVFRGGVELDETEVFVLGALETGGGSVCVRVCCVCVYVCKDMSTWAW